MGKFVNGVLGALTTVGVVMACNAFGNFTARSWASRRLVEHPNDLNAEAVLLLF